MTPTEGLTVALTLAGGFFFLAGTAGLLRFPDLYTRLHALTKADNLGLGFIVIGLALQAESWGEVFKLFLIWMLAMTSAATSAHLVARSALHAGISIWKGRRGGGMAL